MKRKNPFIAKIVLSGETHTLETATLPANTKLAFLELLELARITRNRLLAQGHSIIGNKVIAPKGRVIYEDYRQEI